MTNNTQNILPQLPYMTFVWAEDSNQLIGQEGDLPWSLPAEMQYFKQVTTGGVVVMGRKTYESIPNPPLKNRLNIILTRNKSYNAEGALVFHSKEEILDFLRQENIKKPIHIIGGPALFELFMDEVSVLYRTVINEEFVGDTYMPSINYNDFICIDTTEGTVDENNQHPHYFYVYKRKNIANFFE